MPMFHFYGQQGRFKLSNNLLKVTIDLLYQ
jgi:hypothetical protein